jgi:hypothetical protein
MWVEQVHLSIDLRHLNLWFALWQFFEYARQDGWEGNMENAAQVSQATPSLTKSKVPVLID